jgi:hypothetical protein
MVRLLLSRGAACNIVSKRGRTPLDELYADTSYEGYADRGSFGARNATEAILREAGAFHGPKAQRAIERVKAAPERVPRVSPQLLAMQRCARGEHRWHIEKETHYRRSGVTYRMTMQSICLDCGVTKTV